MDLAFHLCMIEGWEAKKSLDILSPLSVISTSPNKSLALLSNSIHLASRVRSHLIRVIVRTLFRKYLEFSNISRAIAK